MKPGDTIEIAIWLSGTETLEQIERWKTVECAGAIKQAETQHRVLIGPLEFAIKRPGEDRVPQVPDHIHGPDVQLLVGEAKVVYRPDYTLVHYTGFVADLPKDDLAKLRNLTRTAHTKTHPGDRLTNRHCDAVIEALGPDVAVMTLRNGSASH
jgi:hypothetical protein